MQKTVNGVTQSFLWRGNSVAKEYKADGTVRADYQLGVGAKIDGQWQFYLSDTQGSTLAVADIHGKVIATWAYSDYGVTTQTSGDKNLYQPFLYTHSELDLETGYYHNKARHYAPGLGKFLARDPIANSNLYSYCNGDPINFVDPSGLETVPPNYPGGAASCYQPMQGKNYTTDQSIEALFYLSAALSIAYDAYVAAVFIAEAKGFTLFNGNSPPPSSNLPVRVASGTPTVGGYPSQSYTNGPPNPRFVSGVNVVDRRTGGTISGTTDLQPTLNRACSFNSSLSRLSRNDGTVFQNRGGALPSQAPGYYTEWVLPTQGVQGPGPQRIIMGANGEAYYTPDHYTTFILIRKP